MKPASEIAREIAESWIVDCKDCAQDLASCMESPADDPPNRCAILRKKIAAAIEAERDRAEFLRKLLESEGYKPLFCTHCGSDADAGHFECSKWAGQKLNAAETRAARMEKVIEAAETHIAAAKDCEAHYADHTPDCRIAAQRLVNRLAALDEGKE